MTTRYPMMRQAIRARLEAERAEGDARASELTLAAPACARLLVERFGARRVWLFGSIARGQADLRSDLDLAVEGLAPERYFEALGALSDVTPLPIDLVRIEEAEDVLRDAIGAEGRLLLEAAA